MSRVLFALPVVCVLAATVAHPQDTNNLIIRNDAATFFVAPGESAGISLTITRASTAAITNLYITQVLPAGWTFQSATQTSGASSVPAPGASGIVTWHWTTPQFPVEIDYFALASDYTCAALSGAARFRANGVQKEQAAPQRGFFASEDAALEFSRSATPATYTPGGSVDISVTLDENCPEDLSALGITETIPAGWTFTGMVGQTHGVQVQPMSSELNLFWISLPTLPVTITYRLDIPASATGPTVIDGHAIASLGSDDQLTVSLESVLSQSIPQEGEGTPEGEGQAEGNTEGEGEGEGEGEPEGSAEGEGETEGNDEGEGEPEGAEGEEEGEGEDMKQVLLGCSCSNAETGNACGDAVLLGAILLSLIFYCTRSRFGRSRS